MRQIRKIVRDKRGEGYIDVAVMVLCVMLVIALGVRLFPIFITKMQVDNFADDGLSTLFQTNFFRLFFRYCTGV